MVFQDPVQQFLEASLPFQATIGLLVLIAVQQIRQQHIGRVGIVSAGVLVLSTAYPVWNQLAAIWRIYTVVGVGFAAVAAPSYLTKTSLPSGFYRAALILYGGVTLILIFLYGLPL
jgi:hypothetical protein